MCLEVIYGADSRSRRPRLRVVALRYYRHTMRRSDGTPDAPALSKLNAKHRLNKTTTGM